MDQLNHRFNLISDPWVSVVYLDGRARDVSLRTVFHDAHLICQISGDIPQQSLPILRLVLAILYCAYNGALESMTDKEKERQWIGIWNEGHFDMADINDYLQDFYDRFFLFDDDVPFFQVPGLAYQGEKNWDSVTEVIADVPKRDKFLFSLRAKNTIEDLSLSEAVRSLVFLESYDTSGIKTPVEGNTHVNKGKVYPPKGAVGTGWVGALGGVYLEGTNLFETVLLNWCLTSNRSKYGPLAGNTEDRAAWERPVPGYDIQETGGPKGPADLFTWQDRRILLVPNASRDRVKGLIICYGDVFSAMDKESFETMTAWRESRAQMKKLGLPQAPLMPQSLDPSKALWRGLEPLLMYSTDSGGDLRPEVICWMESLQERSEDFTKPLPPIRIHIQGMSYGTQSSVFADAIDDSLDLHASLLRHDSPAVAMIIDVVSATDDAVFELSKLARRVEQVAGNKNKGNPLQAASADVREEAYDVLDAIFRQRIADFDDGKDVLEYGQSWMDQVHTILLRIGERYIDDSAASAFMNRDSGNLTHMSSPRAETIYRSALNRLFGSLRHTAQPVH